MLSMELNGRLGALIAQIEGLEAILNEPISSVMIPNQGELHGSDDFGFDTVGDFLNLTVDTGMEGLFDGQASAFVENGQLQFRGNVGTKG